MSEITLTKSTIRSGIWHGRAMREDGADIPKPSLSAFHLEVPVEGLEVEAVKDTPGLWEVRLAIPASILSDGIQTVVIQDNETGDVVESIVLVAGDPLEYDIRAEVDLLRAELDMLKRAFRRHCLETAS